MINIVISEKNFPEYTNLSVARTWDPWGTSRPRTWTKQSPTLAFTRRETVTWQAGHTHSNKCARHTYTVIFWSVANPTLNFAGV